MPNAASGTPWIAVQNPKIDPHLCAIRDRNGRHIAYTSPVDAVAICTCINRKPTGIIHPNVLVEENA